MWEHTRFRLNLTIIVESLKDSLCYDLTEKFQSYFSDSLMGSASEDEDDDEPHIRGPSLGLGPLGPNGPDSVGPIGPSDLSVQSISTDSKTTHDDSDQVKK